MQGQRFLRRIFLHILILSTVLLFNLPTKALAAADGKNPGSALAMEVAEKGWVQVIVHLKTPFAPEGLMKAEEEAGAQRQRIQSVQQKLLGRLGGGDLRSVKRYKYSPLLALTVNERGLAGLLAAPETERVSKDEWKQLVLAQSAPLIGADDARAAGFTGAGQAVAILDSGVDTAHSFFSGRVVSEACFSTDFPVLDLFTNCPNGLESQTGPGAATPPSSTLFGYDHGTHVAGIAAGGDNITPYSGVAPAAPIIAIQITTNIADQSVGIVTSDMILGLEQVYDLRNTFDIAAVNLSLGSGSHIAACDEDPSKPIIDTLRSVGIASIAASGNEGTTDATLSPACISTAISVGSTEKNDTVSSFSNSASFLDLLAPGGSITSSVPGGGFGIKSGTSMATPHVTGAFAVLRSKNPGVNVVDMLSALANTGQSILDPRNGLTKPRIQVDTALTQIPGISSRDDILVNFGTGTGGLWAYLNDTTWKQLHTFGISVLATGDIDESGKDDVVVVFPGFGTWVYIDNDHWEQVHPFDAEAAVIGDLNDNMGEDIILDFGPGIGLWVRYDNDDLTWTDLHGQSPEQMAVGRLDAGGHRDLIVDFGASGLWIWMNNASWVPLHAFSATHIVTGDIDNNGQDDVIVDFGPGIGIWVFFNNSTWQSLHPLTAGAIATGDLDNNGEADVLVHFPGFGLWVHMNGTDWIQLHFLSPELISTGNIDDESEDEVIVDFGPGIGIWIFRNNTAWDGAPLHGLNPDHLGAADID